MEIIHQIYLLVESLGGGCEELSLIGSFGDTQSDDDVLTMLKQHNKNGTYMAGIISKVGDTPEIRRSRLKLINS